MKQELIRKMRASLGEDVAISFDDDEAPRALHLSRIDPLLDDLVRSAVSSAKRAFPEELSEISAVFVSFEDHLGPTRRRVEL
jgi:hypothetical protein